MSKFDLIIFDADIIIYLSKKGRLIKLFNVCNVFLTQIIYDEIKYYIDDNGIKRSIDKEGYKREGKIKIIDSVSIDMMNEIYKYKEKWEGKGIGVHDGEIEVIAYICKNRKYKMCTGDAGAIRFACIMGIKENLISLEAIIGGKLEHQYSEKFMKNNKKIGSRLKIIHSKFN